VNFNFEELMNVKRPVLNITIHNPNTATETANFLIKEIAKNLSDKIIKEQANNLKSENSIQKDLA
jgi:hypothetical protein